MNMNLNNLAGFTIEKKVLEELQTVYDVIPMANIKTLGNHGPRLESKEAHTTLPDAMIFGERQGCIEIKAKSCSNRWRTWNRYEHGIDFDKYSEYRQFQDKTGMTVYILICEINSGEMLMADLYTLLTNGHPRISQWPNGKKNICWDRKAFNKVGFIKVLNDDLRNINITWNRETLGSFLSQIELPFNNKKRNAPNIGSSGRWTNTTAR